jgi:type I restriction enzyme S subunit
MTAWEMLRLGDRCLKIGSGATPRGGKEAYKGGATSLIRSQNIYNDCFSYNGIVNIDDQQAHELRSVEVKSRDVLLNITGDSVARCCLVADDVLPARVNQHVMIIRPDPEQLSPEFLRYYLTSYEQQNHLLALASAGATRNAITKSMVESLIIKAPNIQTQRAIAQVLGALDDKIALNRRMNATLEAMARALFKDWFVDFGPVRAKIAGSAPTQAHEIWDLFPSAIGADGVPVGWEIKPFNALMASNLGGDWGKESVDEEFNKPVCIIRGTDIPELNAGTRGKVPTRYTTHKKAESRLLAEGDIVIEVSGGSPTQPTGRSLLITNEILNRFNNPMVCASFCRRFRPNSFQAGVFAAQHLALLYAEGGTWEYQNQSTGIANFQTTHFLETEKIIDPGATVLKAFLELVEPMIRQIATNESIELATVRDTLLPRLLSGELSVDALQSATTN